MEPAARRRARALRRRARGVVGKPRSGEGRRLARPPDRLPPARDPAQPTATGSTWSGCSRAIRTGCSTPTATGRCRAGASLERAMQRWHFSAHRHVPRRLLETMERECSALVLSNVQPHAAVPFLVAARRLGLPVVAHVASWDHTVGKGVISPYCDLYVVQNQVMEDDLRRYHGIDSGAGPRDGLASDRHLQARPPARRLRGSPPAIRARPGAARSCSTWAIRRRTLRTKDASSSACCPGGKSPRANASSSSSGRIRATASGASGSARPPGGRACYVQEPSYTDLEELTVLLQHGDAVVANAGTILLDALVNDRPVVCVLYDEGAPPGESWAAKNVVGEHYRELAGSGAFYTAESFDEVVAGIERALERPATSSRSTPARRPRGRGRGRRPGGERVVEAIAGALIRQPTAVRPAGD